MVVPASGFSFSLSAGSKIASVTDSSTAVTHGTPLTINVKSISTNDAYFSESQRHDGKTGDMYTEFDKVTGTLVMSKIDLDALALITGNSVETTGNNKKLKFNANNLPGYFAFAFRSLYNPGNNLPQKTFFYHKCKITGIDFGGGDRAYNDVSVTFDAIPREYDGEYKDYEFLIATAEITFTDLPAA